MPKIAIVDTYYPNFLKTFPHGDGNYESELIRLMASGFGTSDFYSFNLRELGWEVIDIIGNADILQRLWLAENGKTGAWTNQEIVQEQIRRFAPDVVFMQDLSFFNESALKSLGETYLLVGQCSCPLTSVDRIKQFRLLFTSFPHYVGKFFELGVGAEFLPLAFEPAMLLPEVERNLDIVFVGGVGKQLHWRRGTDILESVAATFGERFHWYGYGLNYLPTWSPLRGRFCGEAWGHAMYQIYNRAKIVVNRHGEVAAGYANNLRLYEATGSGAMVITESATNLSDLFPESAVETYRDLKNLLDKIEYYLSHESVRAQVASNGKRHTLANHTYRQRMQKVSQVLMGCL